VARRRQDARVVLALVLAALVGAAPFTVQEVSAAFREETGVRLVRVDSASWRDVTTLAPGTGSTPRLGRFELYVLRPASARKTIAALLRGASRDARGFHWAPDQQGGVTALNVVRPNLVANWFPPGGRRVVDTRWRRLDAAVRALR
jgi:hypothetical protein